MANKRTIRKIEREVPDPQMTGIRPLRRLSLRGRIWSIVFDSSGSTLATASVSGSGESLHIWDFETGKLRYRLGHAGGHSVAINEKGIAAAGGYGGIQLWDIQSGKRLCQLGDHGGECVVSLAFDPTGALLASGSFDNTIKLWDLNGRRLLHTLSDHREWVWTVDFNSQGSLLASASDDGSVKLWGVESGRPLRTLALSDWGRIFAVAFAPSGQILASSGNINEINLWDVETGKLVRRLEGHTEGVIDLAFSPDGRILASRSRDQTIRLWNTATWETVGLIPEPVDAQWGAAGLAFHPRLPVLAATVGKGSSQVAVWEIDFEELLRVDPAVLAQAVHHATGKIVLVGDHSVGKSALAYRLIHGVFKEQSSTHGQQFWVFPDLGLRREDGTDCEAILWDLAGQPDYRLVHALFVDNADLALVMFDASDLRDPLHGVGFWLKQLQAARSRCPIILVPAQTDRGTCPLTPEDLEAFCRREKIAGPIATSAHTGDGIADLVREMKVLIRWEEKAATVTTTTFKRIKDFVLGLKEASLTAQTLVSFPELREQLQRMDPDWSFTDAEVDAAVGHLENYGYVKRLQTSGGEDRVLLQPELLNNLASSFVLEARRHPKGLGALEERRLLSGGYAFNELNGLPKSEADILLDAAALLFLKHHVCFREIDPLRMEPYLVFPELINLKKPPEEDTPTEDGVAYTLVGPVENVFASLVVLLGYTHTFTRTAQWYENARYEMGDGLVCAFRQESERDGELNLVLSFGLSVGSPVRTLFQGLFESFLARRNLTVMRYEPVRCTNRECETLLDRTVVRQRLKEGKTFACCNECGKKLTLPAMAEPIQLTREVEAEVQAQRRVAEQRTRFEQAVFRIRAFTIEQEIQAPDAFISYACGNTEHERWVEKRLATDLQKAGIGVVLDRWHNAQFGKSVARFVERIVSVSRILIVGTPDYRRKYENKDRATGYVVAAEVDLINSRLLGTEAQKESVLPLLLLGEINESLPPLAQGRVHGDFRDDANYFCRAFELIVSLYQLEPALPLVAELVESLRGDGPMKS